MARISDKVRVKRCRENLVKRGGKIKLLYLTPHANAALQLITAATKEKSNTLICRLLVEAGEAWGMKFD